MGKQQKIPELILPLVNKYIKTTIRIMKPIKQEDGLGCAVACVAFVLNISYQEALRLFTDGQIRVREKANFYCPEIVEILNSKGLKYRWQKLGKKPIKEIYSDYSIVFIKRSENYPYGHFLARYKNKWMNPWINLPDKNIKAGFQDILREEPTYVIYRSL